MDLRGYLRQISTLPPRVVLGKAVALTQRTIVASGRLVLDIVAGSYGADRSNLNPAARICITADDIAPELESTLRVLAREYLQHRFDLLGSGWTSPVYGILASGFLGWRFASRGPAAPDPAGRGLEVIVNRSNLAQSRRIWQLISRRDYTPIDWQLDWRSGYRWSARRPSLTLPIPVDRGADVKLPWELGRLQHLPQLALCAILAAAGSPDFEPPSRYVDEIADQLIDFIATNPPRFGVNWMCPMDVGIRAANIALTIALLSGAGLALKPEVTQVVANSLNDHASHVVEHLEYSETGRSNHYIADLGGILWSSWLLTGEEAERRLAFAIAEIFKEADHQFLADGGNYEGSTSYHRLSAEIILFSVAVILSLDQAALAKVESASPPRRLWRAAFPTLPLKRYRDSSGGLSIIPPAVFRTLDGAAQLSRTVQGGDRTAIQIGDTDSGRFFKLHPTAISNGTAKAPSGFVENNLDQTGFIDSVDVLFGAAPQGRRLDAIVTHRLAGASGRRDLSRRKPEAAHFGDLSALIARWGAAPEASRRVRRLPLGIDVKPDTWTQAGFPEFGLYVFKHNEGLLISFRCFGAPPLMAPSGHRHDDNLAVEYRFRSTERRDPGTFVYTPSVEQRNRYRAAAAHDVPRICGQSITTVGNALFELKQIAYAQCLCWRPNAVAGEIATSAGKILRILQISGQALAIYDCVEGDAEIAELSPELPVSMGYGRL